MNGLTDLFGQVQQALFEALVQPAMFKLGLGSLFEEGYDATGWLLVGLIQIAVMLCVFAPLQRWRPVEVITDRAAIRVDIVYTLIHRLGLFRLALFFALDPLWDALFGYLHVHGMQPLQLDQVMAPWWPGVLDTAWSSFVLYLLVFDFANYWLHRAQHQFNWWWALHSLHHSQRQMTMWSDDRNHLLDSALTDAIFVIVAIVIGVAPSQFVWLVAVTQLMQSLQHANLRCHFGRLGERLLVSPRFHRRHHAIGIGHEARAAREPGAAGPSQGASAPLGGSAPRAAGSVGAHVRGVNFGVLLPCWDALLGSADFSGRFEPTGIRDQVEQGRDYGRGFWAQQWRGLLRLAGRA